MKKLLLLVLLFPLSVVVYSQASDFIILKKRNNRTIKTYYPGAFISAVTINGFNINGFIKVIRNDSIILQQQETRLMGTEFGSAVDTLKYTLGINYREIEQFNYTSKYVWGHRKGFAVITLPKLMIVGGIGYLALELVNTAYRGESINDHNKLPTLAISAGVALAGFVWQETQKQSNKAGGKYKVVYMKMGTAK